MTRVAFVKTADRIAGTGKALDLLEVSPTQGRPLFLKPNFNSADPTPGSTHNDVLVTLVHRLRAMGAGPITVGDRSGGGDTREVMKRKGIFALAEEIGFDLLVFDELEAADWQPMQIPGSHWRRGFAVARPLLDAETVVQTCCLKTHRFGGHFTLSLKNSVGVVAKQLPGDSYDYMGELHGSPHQRLMIAEINASYEADLVVLDGVQAFVDGGPDKGKQIAANVILAGTDRVAIDAVGVALLRYHGTTHEVSRGPIFQLEQIARAADLRLGVTRPEEIEFVTGDPESAAYAEQIHRILMKG